MTSKSQTLSRSRSHVGGFTLVELMIAMLLGLILVGSALAIFTTNKRTYVTTENLGRVQENGRVAFELMSREVREAGGTPCSKKIPVANVLNNPGANWWSNWTNPIKGYGGADDMVTPVIGVGVADRVTGTDGIELKSTFDSGATLVKQPSATSADFQVLDSSGLQPADVVMVCDYRQATILQITGVPNGTAVVHSQGAGSPGNCSKGMGFPTICTVNGNPYVYQPNAIIAKLHATRWYIGNNARGGRSLYQNAVNGGVAVAQEVTEGVRDMQLQYLLQGASDYVAAASVGAGNWKNVIAVRINLTLEGRDKVGTDGKVLSRSLAHTVNLRNRTS